MENRWEIDGKSMENRWKIDGNRWKIDGKSMEINENRWKSMKIDGNR